MQRRAARANPNHDRQVLSILLNPRIAPAQGRDTSLSGAMTPVPRKATLYGDSVVVHARTKQTDGHNARGRNLKSQIRHTSAIQIDRISFITNDTSQTYSPATHSSKTPATASPAPKDSPTSAILRARQLSGSHTPSPARYSFRKPR